MLRRARLADVLVPGTHPDTWQRTRRCAEERGLTWALGVHPWFLTEVRDIPLDGAFAVGECGLDGARPDMELQRRVLRVHLELAREHGLPVLLHCVRAHAVLLEELRAFAPLRGLMHSYSGSAEMVPDFVRLGLSISFGGVLTWPGAKKAKKAALEVPLDHLFVESDGPDQAVQSRRGGRSEPADVHEVAAAVLALRGEGVLPGWRHLA